MALIAALVLMAEAAPAFACDDPQTQSAMTQCAGRDYERADAALNRQWSKTVAAMKAQDKGGHAPTDGRPGYYAALLESQRAWLRFRDAQCRVQGYAMRGGSAEPMIVNGCMASLTKTRTQQLKDLEQGS